MSRSTRWPDYTSAGFSIRLFVRESSGKTQLCAKLANGTVRVIATM